jgi:hypothetical protein
MIVMLLNLKSKEENKLFVKNLKMKMTLNKRLKLVFKREIQKKQLKNLNSQQKNNQNYPKVEETKLSMFYVEKEFHLLN